MDFAEGGELFYMLREKGRMSENEAIFYSAQIVLAIEHLHSMGVLYRDLKPENILLDKSGYLLLTDFGLAKKISKTNSFCGTPDYIPPEIIRNKCFYNVSAVRERLHRSREPTPIKLDKV